MTGTDTERIIAGFAKEPGLQHYRKTTPRLNKALRIPEEHLDDYYRQFYEKHNNFWGGPGARGVGIVPTFYEFVCMMEEERTRVSSHHKDFA